MWASSKIFESCVIILWAIASTKVSVSKWSFINYISNSLKATSSLTYQIVIDVHSIFLRVMHREHWKCFVMKLVTHVCLLQEKKSVNSLFRKFLIFSSLSYSLHKQIIDLNSDLTWKANSSNFAIVFMWKHHPLKKAKLWCNFKVCKRVTCLDCE